ncbi:MAG: putative sulfate exporter family transporter [Chloroflexi bacterium]|nr:putative sulfate exporter family transporter [Chloroflexota bacterium]
MKGIDWSSLWKKEDWLAVWLGFLIMALVVFGIWVVQTPTYRWTTDAEFTNFVQSKAPELDQLLKGAEAKGEKGLATETTALLAAIQKGDRAAIASAAGKLDTASKDAKDKALKTLSSTLARDLRTQSRALLDNVLTWDNIQKILIIGVIYLVLASIGIFLKGGNIRKFALGFPVVFFMAVLAQFLAGNYTSSTWGLEFVLWALILGLLVSNLIKLPAWLKEAVQTEYFIKTGLVIFGASILFSEIVSAGALGLVQGLIVISTVWYGAYWLLRKVFKLDDGFAAVMSSAVAICGVSAAIAAHGAVKGDSKKLSYVTSLVLLIAMPMMILQPFFAKLVNLPEAVAGAWMAGTIDTTAAVVVAGAMVGETAMKYASILKLTQNALIGVVAFILAVAWTFKDKAPGAERPSVMEVWYRFPKFVLGFIVASVIFSLVIDPAVVTATKSMLGHLRVVWFALAFVCIGLDTRFADLIATGGGKPALGFVTAQLFNIVWVLLLAYLLFGGVFFPPPF